MKTKDFRQRRLPVPIISISNVGIRLNYFSTFLNLFSPRLASVANNLQRIPTEICLFAIPDLVYVIPHERDNYMWCYKKGRKIPATNKIRFFTLRELQGLNRCANSKWLDPESSFGQIIICYCCKYNNVTFIRIQQTHEIGLVIFG